MMTQMSRARELMRESTDAERLLWSRLHNRRLMGLKFRRQYPNRRIHRRFRLLRAQSDHRDRWRAPPRATSVRPRQGRVAQITWIQRDSVLATRSFRILTRWWSPSLSPSPQPSPSGRGGIVLPEAPQDGPGQQVWVRWRRVGLVAAAVAVVLVILYLARAALFPFIMSVVLAQLFYPVVTFLETRLPGHERLPGAAASCRSWRSTWRSRGASRASCS